MIDAIEFRKDDRGYMEWIKQHPRGFVLNRQKGKTDTYLTLHTARCRQISKPLGNPYAYTAARYIKVCAERIEPLEAHAQRHGGSLHRCRVCNP